MSSTSNKQKRYFGRQPGPNPCAHPVSCSLPQPLETDVHAVQATAALQKACGAELEGRTASVQVPAVGQRIDASTGSSAFHALLSEKLLTGLSMRPMGGYHIAWLNAVAAPPPLVSCCSLLICLRF